MRILLNTLFHGDKTTKALLWGCVAAILAGAALIGVFAFTLYLPWLIGAIIALLVPLVIIRNYDFSDKLGARNTAETEKTENKTLNKTEKTEVKKEKNNAAITEIFEKTKEKPEQIPEKKRKTTVVTAEASEENQEGLRESEEKGGKAKLQPAQKESKAAEEKGEDIQLTEIHQQVREETGENLPEEYEEAREGKKESQGKGTEEPERKLKQESSEKPEKTEKTEKTVKPEKLPVADKRGLKQLFFKYKVKREHRPVIIDSSVRWNVENCPAYMWIARGMAHFLLMEESPREIVIDAKHATISYCVENAEPSKEYGDLRNNALFMQLFGECLPSYRDEFVNRRRVSTKSLYLVDDDIKLTNSSARAAFDLMKAGFELPERYNLPDSVGTYTREAHKTKILWQDGVISTNEFKNRTKNLLQEMTESNISGIEFDKNLLEMVNRQLITREYAEYYSSIKRDENAQKENKKIKISNF